MQLKGIPLFALAIVSATVMTGGGCSDKEYTANKIELQVNAEPEQSHTSLPENSSSPIRAAMLAVGAKCDGRKRSRSGCKWQGVSYTVNEPIDWDAQIATFRSNCEAGVFSAGYNVVSDRQSWIVSTANGAEPTTRVYTELAKQSGLRPEAKLVKLCDL